MSRVVSSPPMRRLLRWAFESASAVSDHLSLGAILAIAAVFSLACVLGAYSCLVQMDHWAWVIDPVFPTLGRAPTTAEEKHAQAMIYLWLAAPACVSMLGLAGAAYLGVLVRQRWLRDHNRRLANCCPICGYDLRATPDRCPECGTEDPRRPVAAASAAAEEARRVLRWRRQLPDDRRFYDSLGPEASSRKCKRDECERGVVSLSVFCRVHHYESVQGRTCPFND
jgi:hypothetical protein